MANHPAKFAKVFLSQKLVLYGRAKWNYSSSWNILTVEFSRIKLPASASATYSVPITIAILIACYHHEHCIRIVLAGGYHDIKSVVIIPTTNGVYYVLLMSGNMIDSVFGSSIEFDWYQNGISNKSL